ncbi:hypothetical protein BIW11_08270 [Tropilaelaps mercedesae]|uniref:Uncharacterized protein n=1 Tax=Tropilaelaps mercedesae TaxID=418985 RepID=A0A1V9XQ93_9ACAR|nr:hypothetical protein BIW11_08270 [Tropilaelaps mercedesae]
MLCFNRQSQDACQREQAEKATVLKKPPNLLDVIYDLSDRGTPMQIPNSSYMIQLRPYLGTELIVVHDVDHSMPHCVLRCIERSLGVPDLMSFFYLRGLKIPYTSIENTVISKVVQLRCGGSHVRKTKVIELKTLRGILLALGLTNE